MLQKGDGLSCSSDDNLGNGRGAKDLGQLVEQVLTIPKRKGLK